MLQLYMVLAIFVIVIIMFCSGKVSIPTGAMFCCVALFVTGVLDFKEAFSGLANASVVMMAAMFICGGALAKTSILKRISGSIIKPGASDRKIMFGFTVMIALLGCFINAAATVAILMPMVFEVCREQKRAPSKYIQLVCILSNLWAGLIPLGGNAGMYLGNNTMIENLGGVGGWTFFTAMIAKAPITLLLSAFAIFFGTKLTPDNGLQLEEVSNSNAADRALKKSGTLSPKQEKITLVVFCATIIGIIACALTKNDVTKPAVLGAIFMVFIGTITPKEIPTTINLPIIFIFVGMLPLSTALAKTGGDELIAAGFTKVMGNANNSRVVMTLLFLVNCVLTQFMSNTAVSNIFKPIAALIAIQCGYSPVACMLASTHGSAASYCTPMASPPQTIGFSMGKYTMKQYAKTGIVFAILQLMIFLVWVPFVFPA